ncbi:MAG: hypothetical protein LBG45_00200, partial [Dysgonamonadaceae bacterium]|nr:hypothetical protein [Dysgonamonadaceae bacterium]
MRRKSYLHGSTNPSPKGTYQPGSPFAKFHAQDVHRQLRVPPYRVPFTLYLLPFTLYPLPFTLYPFTLYPFTLYLSIGNFSPSALATITATQVSP